MRTFKLFSILVVIALLMAACSTPTVAPTVAPTSVPATKAPEATKAIEATKVPEATKAPVATAASAVPAACASDAFGCAKIAAGQTVKIGMGGPMTGDNASFGIDISQGGKIAITDSGDVQGWKFELVSQDDGGTAEGGAAVANKLVADQTVVAIAGHIFSGATAAAIPIYEKLGLPMLSPSATNPDLTKNSSKVFNRIAFTDTLQGQFAAQYLQKTLNIKNLAILHDGSTYGKGLAEVVQKTFTANGGTVTSFDAITSGDSDFTAILSKVAAKKPEALYFGGYIQDAVVLANQMKQSGLDKAIFFGCDGTFGADFIKRAAKNAEGAYAVSLTPPDSDVKTKFDTAYKTAFGKAAGELSPFTWNGYDVVAALVATVKQVAIKGGDGNLYIPRGALVTAVRGLKNYKGLTGTFTCDATGECNSSGPIFYIVKDGKWVAAAK